MTTIMALPAKDSEPSPKADGCLLFADAQLAYNLPASRCKRLSVKLKMERIVM